MAITAKEFFNIWKEVCESETTEKELLRAWSKGPVASYSEVVLGRKNVNSIVVEVLKLLNKKINDRYDIHQEYYSCDVAFYEKDKMLEKVDEVFGKKRNRGLNSVWLKEISIHMEHENDISFSWQEITQLMVIPGKELNVLVTYPNNKKDTQKLLEAYREIIGTTNKNSWLIIFGYTENNGTEIVWVGYEDIHHCPKNEQNEIIADMWYEIKGN